MDGFWEKISSYNIFNNLFPGAFFIYFLERAIPADLSGNDIVKSVILYYFVGLVIGRIGSLFLEPILKLVKLIRFSSYEDYLAACAKDSKIETLLEVANMYRTLFSMSLILLASFYVVSHFVGAGYGLSKFISLCLVIIFIVSYIKQIKYVVKRIESSKAR